MEKAQAAVDAAKDAAVAAEQGNSQDEKTLERAKEAAQEAISKAEEINQQEQANASNSEETIQASANQEQLDKMREDVNNLDASMTPLDKQRQEVRDAADKAENAAESMPLTTTQEERTDLRKEAVEAAIDAYEKADMSDPVQSDDVQRAKEAALEALKMDTNMSKEEMEEAQELLDAIPDEEDALQEAFDKSGLPDDLFDEFKEGWDEYMAGIREEFAKGRPSINLPSPDLPDDMKEWLKRIDGKAAYYVNVKTGKVELLEDAPTYGSDWVMVMPYNTGTLDRQGQPLVIPSVLEGVAEWWYQSGNRREDLIYEDSTELRIVNGANWVAIVDGMRFFNVERDGNDLIVRY
jgi:hypothetical protein